MKSHAPITVCNASFLKNIQNRHGDDINLHFLSNCNIIKAGILETFDSPEEGIFAIDYIDENKVPMRIVFGGNDMGLWVSWHGELGKASPEDLLKERINKVINDPYSLNPDGSRIIFDEKRNGFSIVSKRGKRQVEKEELFLSRDDLKLMNSHVRCSLNAINITQPELAYSAIAEWALC